MLFIRILSGRPLPRMALFSALALLWSLPILRSAGEMNDFRDAHVLTAYEYAAEKTLTSFGELPLWNPYYCGGMYLLGTPQSRYAAPPFGLSLALGAVSAQALIAFVMLLIGMEGFFRYVKHRTASALGPLLAAPTWTLSGFMATSYFRGWIGFFGFLLLPWILHGIDLAARGRYRGVLLCSTAYAFIVGFGGTYAAPMAALCSVLEIARLLFERRRSVPEVKRLVFFALITGLAAILLSSFRLYPIVETLYSAPRVMAGTPKNHPIELLQMLLGTAEPTPGKSRSAGCMFFGTLPLALAFSGLARRKGVIVAVLVALCFWIATGYSNRFGLFVFLRELPVYETLRYPERFLFLAVFYCAELAAFGVDRCLALRRVRRYARLAPHAAVLLTIIAVSAQIRNAYRVFDKLSLAPMPAEIDRDFHQARGNRWLLSYYAPMSRGSLSCWEAYPVSMSPLLKGNLLEEEYLLDPGKGEVTRRHWSPNRIDLEVRLHEGTRVLINQNWHQGWRSPLGKVVNHEGLLAVDLPAGEHRVSLRFRPKSAWVGGAVSLLTLLGLVWVGYRTSRGKMTSWKRQAMGIFAPPVLCGLLLGFSIDEPPPAPPEIRNADGKPALLEALPPDVDEIHVSFALPVRLLGYRISERTDALGILDVELFWRITGQVPRSVGVFVELKHQDDFTETAIHEVLSSSLFLDEAPRNAVIRDSFSVRLPDDQEGTFEAFAGLVHLTGGKARVQAFDDQGNPLPEDRVRLGDVTHE